MADISNRDRWLFGEDSEQFSFDKKSIQDLYVKKFLLKTQRMFKYTNLPGTIPQRDLELIMQCSGCVTIAKVNDKLYAFKGSLGGTPNEYYLPTISIVANPYLHYNANLTIDKDCVVMLNDSLYEGLLPQIQHASNLLAECDISFKFTTINIRVPAIIEATNDTSKTEAENFLQKVEEGSKLGVICGEQFLDRINVYNYASSEYSVQHLIELKQYIYGTFLQELGIQSSFNMKREAINEAEASLNTDILYPLIDDMLMQRKIGVDKINKMYGTNIEVELDSVWKQLREQQDIAIREQESEILVNEAQANDTTEETIEMEKTDEQPTN